MGRDIYLITVTGDPSTTNMAINPDQVEFVRGDGRAFVVYMASGREIVFTDINGVAKDDFTRVWEASLRGILVAQTHPLGQARL